MEKQQAMNAIMGGFVSQFDVELIDLKDDALYAIWYAKTKDLNPANVVQGGAAYAVADALCAVLGYKDLHVLTKSGHFYYFSSLLEGEIHIYCRHTKKGKFSSLAEVELWQNDRLSMKGTFDMAKMKVEEK